MADTEEAHRQAFNEAFKLLDLPWHWEPALYAELLEVTGGKERMRSYIERLDIEPGERQRLNDLVTRIHAAKTRLYTEAIARGSVRARAGVRRLMREARADGIRLAIASTTTPENIDSLLKSAYGADAPGWFDVIASGDIVANKKPAPDIYCVALETLGVAPEEAIAVEDSAVGVAAARAARLYTIVTPSRWTRRQDFSQAQLVLESLGEPDQPLAATDRQQLGAAFLSFKQLAALHAAYAEGNGHA